MKSCKSFKQFQLGYHSLPTILYLPILYHWNLIWLQEQTKSDVPFSSFLNGSKHCSKWMFRYLWHNMLEVTYFPVWSSSRRIDLSCRCHFLIVMDVFAKLLRKLSSIDCKLYHNSTLELSYFRNLLPTFDWNCRMWLSLSPRFWEQFERNMFS